jgi:hypothetical protein
VPKRHNAGGCRCCGESITCFADGDCPASFVPNDLFITDSNGIHPLTRVLTASSPAWTTCYLVEMDGLFYVDSDHGVHYDFHGFVAVGYTLVCPFSVPSFPPSNLAQSWLAGIWSLGETAFRPTSSHCASPGFISATPDWGGTGPLFTSVNVERFYADARVCNLTSGTANFSGGSPLAPNPPGSVPGGALVPGPVTLSL